VVPPALSFGSLLDDDLEFAQFIGVDEGCGRVA
jgi:hypothetical protein